MQATNIKKNYSLHRMDGMEKLGLLGRLAADVIFLCICILPLVFSFYHAYRLIQWKRLLLLGKRTKATISFVTTDSDYIRGFCMKTGASYTNINSPAQTSYRIHYKFRDDSGNDITLKVRNISPEYGWSKKEGDEEEIVYIPDGSALCSPVDYVSQMMSYHLRWIIIPLVITLMIMIGELINKVTPDVN